MKSYFVYILKCSDYSYYTGVTSDISRRVEEHQAGVEIESYTFKRRPVELVFCSEFEHPYDAIRSEKQIKGWNRKKKEALINNDFDLIHELAKCLNDTSHLNYMPFDSAQDDKLNFK